MTKGKVGLILFWVGVAYAVLWGVILSGFIVVPAWKNLTMDELNQTIWQLQFGIEIWPTFGIGTVLWLSGFPLGTSVAGIGILLRSGAKGSRAWKLVIGIVLISIIPGAMMAVPHFPPFFGIGGTLIVVFFFGMLWLWAKERMALQGTSTAAADLKLAGYVSMGIAAWWI